MASPSVSTAWSSTNGGKFKPRDSDGRFAVSKRDENEEAGRSWEGERREGPPARLWVRVCV